MHYDSSGSFLHADKIEDPAQIVTANYWRDAALHMAEPFGDYMTRTSLRRVS